MEFNLADLFESVVDTVPERIALVSGEQRFTYAELDSHANRIASFLTDSGVVPGEHVGMYLHNCSEYLVALLAVFKIRAVPVNINYRYVEEELRYMCDDSDLVALFYHRGFGDRLAAVRKNLKQLRTLVHVEDGKDVTINELESTSYDLALREGRPERDFEARSGEDLYIIYTGGTTGMPKGVMWRHQDVFFAGLQGGRPGGEDIKTPEELAEVVANSGALTLLPAAPLIHGAAQWSSLVTFFGGGKTVLQPGPSFSAERCVELISEEGVNTIALVGDAMAMPIAEAAVVKKAEIDTSSLFAMGSAGAVLSEAVKEQLREAFPGLIIIDSFGATETGHQGSMLEGSGHGAGEAPRFAMSDSNRVYGEDLKPVEPGSGVIGKLARRGYIPMGYYNDEAKTASTFVTIDGERWSMPGDLATVEADGTIQVFGRGTVCINTGGEKVFPEEVEAALKAHAAVADAVVVGVPDPNWGQRVAALVRLRSGCEATADDLKAHCRTKVAGYKTPRCFVFVDEVVRQPSGKPDYRWAAEFAANAAAADGSE